MNKTCPPGFIQYGQEQVMKCSTSPCPEDSKRKMYFSETVLLCVNESWGTNTRVHTNDGFYGNVCC